MSRIIFVTTELRSETRGGAGVVMDALARGVGDTRECLVLLLSPTPVEVAERDQVSVEIAPILSAGFLERSQVAAEALARVVQPGDRVEFQDFEGLGYWALSHRVEYGMEEVAVTVRFHGPYDLISQVMETTPEEWKLPSAMEAEVFAMADAVLIPAPGHLETLVSRYGVEAERIVLAPPPIPTLPRVARAPTQPPVFAVVGRLGEMKGSQDLVRAALTLLRKGTELRVRFIGDDGWSPTASTGMREWLESMIGPECAGAFEFTGHVDRDRLPTLLEDATAMMVPSRFESFALAAHEARQMGLPVVVPDIAAFRELFGEATGALVYDATIAGLTEALKRLVTEEGLADELAARPAPDPGDPWEAYATDPQPRHPRSQAGLATAATKRVEAVMTGRARQVRTLQRTYRFLPAPLARVAAAVVPRWLKDRLRRYASWPAEEARRAKMARLAAVEARIAAGEFPEVEAPEVTVVIPVYDDVRYLEETLASVYEQSCDSWEIVVVDDGSKDPDAVAFLDSLEARPRLRLVRQANKGLPGARNAGIAAGRGRFIVPLDSDDELDPHYLERMVTALEANPEAAYAHCYARLHHDIDAYWITRPFNPYWQLLENGVVGCVLLRRDAWEQVGGYDETMASGNEDWELWVRLLEAGWGQVQVPEVLFRYRKHGISMSVHTEARFEEGRRAVRDRHPDLFALPALREMKARWYPLVTVLADSPVPGEDVETIGSVEELATSWGKYVVDARGVGVTAEVLGLLADALEADQEARSARTTATPPLVMVRRWNLHDPQALPSREAVVDHPQTGPFTELPEHVERESWTVPKGLEADIPVQRQRPEESGHLPDPTEW